MHLVKHNGQSRLLEQMKEVIQDLKLLEQMKTVIYPGVNGIK